MASMLGPYLFHNEGNPVIQVALIVPEKEALDKGRKITLNGRFKTMAWKLLELAGKNPKDWNCKEVYSDDSFSFLRPEDSYYNFYRKRYTFFYEGLDSGGQKC